LLNQEEAVRVDEELMVEPGFSLDQLMELAGLSCACATAEAFPVATHPLLLLVCGPGNNGGDGLVAARHLHHFGYTPVVLYPKRTDRQIFKNLVTQLEWLGVPVLKSLEEASLAETHAVVDCIFGFSFKGAVRPPFDAVLPALAAEGAPPIISVDIPSGWDVETGPPAEGVALRPAALISLTAPKMCARFFEGRHFLGGRFVPPAIVDKYKLELPTYPGASQFVELAPAKM